MHVNIINRPVAALMFALVLTAVISASWALVAHPPKVQADSPGQPSNLRAEDSFPLFDGADGVRLTWTAPSGTVDGYHIMRQRPGCDESMSVHIADTQSTTTNYIDTDVGSGVAYTYQIKAINSDATGAASEPVSHTYIGSNATYGQDFGPEQPTTLKVWNTLNGIQLKWRAPDPNGSAYQILRRRTDQCEPFQTLAADTGKDQAHWFDANADDSAHYEYRVAALNHIADIDENREGPHSAPESILRTSTSPSFIYGYLNKHTFPEGRIPFHIAINHLQIDDDTQTVDYTFRGDVTRSDDGSDADYCEDVQLGVDRQVTKGRSQLRKCSTPPSAAPAATLTNTP